MAGSPFAQFGDKAMTVALRLKFQQHPVLLQRLRATGEADLIEWTPRDGYWAVHVGTLLQEGRLHTGRLGELLMELRKE
jgi:predicted NAD-dependent protein-ADP-ribosyltransferase YbiA (DUF1768 family)